MGPFHRPLFCLWFRTTLERLGLGSNDDPVVTLVSQPVVLPEEDDVERRQFLSIAAVAPVAAALTPSGLDEVRARMNHDLRHALPTDEIDFRQLITADHVYGTTAPATMLRRMAPI
ncbi:hypothetical protein ACGFNU_14880 [Spirillospora sp. NPDC048911]|uniref:hypothetical protein n=1 Tax=Spirillospora sp. NPDC048911 TaxID=3364527 RepID=UPI00371C5477